MHPGDSNVPMAIKYIGLFMPFPDVMKIFHTDQSETSFEFDKLTQKLFKCSFGMSILYKDDILPIH